MPLGRLTIRCRRVHICRLRGDVVVALIGRRADVVVRRLVLFHDRVVLQPVLHLLRTLALIFLVLFLLGEFVARGQHVTDLVENRRLDVLSDHLQASTRSNIPSLTAPQLYSYKSVRKRIAAGYVLAHHGTRSDENVLTS
ncbi:hypothetical protein PMAYCL1PPCAC_31980 [Pristionchus mayeri]|uniref:Uncharacterized protein n=1 Tax=Pristionchus mayeri TaxID=1317129 RepID=A0AAN5IF09_9BILA|nr:hypothetical protein PMAYCL1PPCAC_31980 [Pristionchus mayeri]